MKFLCFPLVNTFIQNKVALQSFSCKNNKERISINLIFSQVIVDYNICLSFIAIYKREKANKCIEHNLY